jgi:rhodanese-related sulfurtransferase
MKSRSLIVGVVAAALFVIPSRAHAIGWALVNARIRSEFPQVRRISTAELAQWLSDSSRPAPLLLDVRTRAEYAVSHLQGARHVEPGAPAAVINEGKDRPIVTYCSVGYRSGAFAKKLSDAGFTNVVNLEGSIFRWANEGRPVFRGSRKVNEVHPYNRTWGMLLKKARRADVPPADARSASE